MRIRRWRLQSAASRKLSDLVVNGQSDPRPDSQEELKSGATLNEKGIYEASHGMKFLAISLRDEDGTPWLGDALYSTIIAAAGIYVKRWGKLGKTVQTMVWRKTSQASFSSGAILSTPPMRSASFGMP